MESAYDQKVQEQIKRLNTCSWQAIEREVILKRIAWFAQKDFRKKDNLKLSPRLAFEALFFDYMGLTEDDLPIELETEEEIIWRSRNHCPTLDACKTLGLDTKQVCRAVYEKSTQAFVSQLDPQLRFLRSYETIRPYADHCREWIVRVDFEAMMSMAFEEATISQEEGNKGYGAVIAMGNRVIGKAHDTAVTGKDPSLHAEVNAIRQAVRNLDDANLCGAILFSTCEPCPMCSSLAVWANLTTIVYGISIQETTRLGKSRILVSSKEIIDRSPVMIEVIDGVLKDECGALYL